MSNRMSGIEEAGSSENSSHPTQIDNFQEDSNEDSNMQQHDSTGQDTVDISETVNTTDRQNGATIPKDDDTSQRKDDTDEQIEHSKDNDADDDGTGRNWPAYEDGVFDIWGQLSTDSRLWSVYNTFVEKAFTQFEQPLPQNEAEYDRFVEFLEEDFIEGSLSCWKFEPMLHVPFVDLFEVATFDRVTNQGEATGLTNERINTLRERMAQISSGTIGERDFRTVLQRTLSEELEEASQNLDDHYFELRLAGEFSHVKQLHKDIAPKLQDLYKLCQTPSVKAEILQHRSGSTQEPGQVLSSSPLQALLQEINEMNEHKISQENAKMGLPDYFGLVPVDMLKIWYSSDTHAKDELIAQWHLWANHQLPLGFLRKKPYAMPAFEGRYPQKDNVASYRKITSKVDVFERKALSTADSESEKKNLFDAHFESQFMALIYPPSKFQQIVRKTPDVRSFANTDTFIRKESQRIPFEMQSFGMSTETFEPGVTIFGGRIVAMQTKQLEPTRASNRSFMVETQPQIYQMYNENEVGGPRIYELCRGLPDIVPIVGKSEDSMPTSQTFQKHGFGVEKVAFRRMVTTPARSQPPSYVVVWYRESESGPKLYVGMSKACLVALVGKKLADTVINMCVTPPKDLLQPTLEKTLTKQHPKLVIRSQMVADSVTAVRTQDNNAQNQSAAPTLPLPPPPPVQVTAQS